MKLNNLTEEELIEQRKIREKMMNKADLEIFNKFKKIVFLGDNEVVTINQVAEYYEVSKRTIDTITQRHKDELNQDGIKVLKQNELKDFKKTVKTNPHYEEDLRYIPHLTIFPRRAVLRVGMLLRDSEIAKQIRDYLLNVEEISDNKTKQWAVLRKAGIIVRKDFTADIARSGEPSRMGNSAYGYYTNMAYILLFGKKADQLKKEMGVDSIRDNISEESLEELRRTERSIGGLLLADFKKEEILNMLS